jgi:hypothetical protein
LFADQEATVTLIEPDPGANTTGLLTGCEVAGCGRPVAGMLEVEVSRPGITLTERARLHQVGLCAEDMDRMAARPPNLSSRYQQAEGGPWRPRGATYR